MTKTLFLPLGRAVDEPADVADVLLLELVDLLVLLVELLQLEGPRALGARVVEVVHLVSPQCGTSFSGESVPVPARCAECGGGHVDSLQGRGEN